MSEFTKTVAQLSHLNDYDLVQLFLASRKAIRQRGLNIEAVKRPSNSQYLKGNRRSFKNYKQLKEFDDFVAQDWGYLIPESAYSSKKEFYVYVHCDPRKPNHNMPIQFKKWGVPFYVGKGIGDRYLSKSRSKPHLKHINGLSDIGFKMADIAHIYQDSLTEREAIELESKLINYFGCFSELSGIKRAYINGLKRGCLVNTDTGYRPKEIEDFIQQIKGF